MKCYLGFECGLCTKNGIWFSSYIGNALYYYDGINTKYIGMFPGEEKASYRLFSDVVKYRNLLIFTPLLAKHITVYDIEKKEFKILELKEWVPKRMGQGKFCTSILVGEYLYMFPEYYPGIVKICLRNMEVEILDEWIKELEKRFVLNNDVFFQKDFDDCGEYLYFPLANTNAVLEFNKKSEEIHLYSVGNGKYSSIAKWNDLFILGGREQKEIWCWEKESNKCFIIQNTMKNYDNTRFIASIIEKDICWMFPDKGSKVLKIDLNKRSVDTDNSYSDGVMCRSNVSNQHFSFVKRVGNKIVAYAMKTMTLHIYNMETCEKEKRKLEVPEKFQEEYNLLWEKYILDYAEQQLKKGCVNENEIFSINTLVELEKRSGEVKVSNGEVGICGKRIFDIIC